MLDRLLATNKKLSETEQECDDLRKTVASSQSQSGPEQETALEVLKAGQTDKAEALFQKIAESQEKLGAKANSQAAQAWRHIGTLAFLHDTQKALGAYTKAVDLARIIHQSA